MFRVSKKRQMRMSSLKYCALAGTAFENQTLQEEAVIACQAQKKEGLEIVQ